MSQPALLAESFSYGLRLIEAGAHGIRIGNYADVHRAPYHMTKNAEHNLKTAVIAGSAALILLTLTRRQRGRLNRLLACGTVALCAEMIWRTRDTSAQLIERATKEMNLVRDQHWLKLHPIDYA